MQDIKKNQMKILELKNTIAKYKNSVDGLHIRIEDREERICRLENRTIENTQCE